MGGVFLLKNSWTGFALAGGCAGAVTGIFGAGGGMVLVPLLTLLTGTEEDALFPTSVSMIGPICLTTAVCTALTGGLAWREALPYMLGSGAGGALAGKWGSRIPVKWLHRTLGLLILWGGVRYLC